MEVSKHILRHIKIEHLLLDKLFLQEEKKNEKIILNNRNGFVDEVYGHKFEQEGKHYK